MAYQFPLNGGRINASIGGNSTSAGAGYSVVSTGTLLLAGGNNITLSQNGSAITISGANAPSGSINFSASNASANLASVTFSNSNGLSFGLNAGVITASHNGISSQSNQALSASNGSFAFQTARFSDANGVTFGTSAGSIMTASVNTSYAASNHSHGNPSLNLTNISGTTASASNGLTLSLSAASQSVQTQNRFNLSLSGNTTGTLAHISSGTLTLAGGSNITLSQNGNAITIVGGSSSGGGTVTDQSLYVNGDGGQTTGWRSEGGDYTRVDDKPTDDGDTTRLYSVTNNEETSFTLENGVGITGAVNSVVVHALVKSLDPVSSTFQIFVRIGGTNYYSDTKDTVTNNTSYIDFSYTWATNPATSSAWTSAEIDALEVGVKKINSAGQRLTQMFAVVNATTGGGGGGVAFSAGISTQGNTGGTTGFASNQIMFAGGNNITLSQSTGSAGNTLSIIGGGGGGGVALYDGVNSISSGTARLSAGGALTASINGQTLSLSAPAQSSLSATGIVSISRNASTISIGVPAFSVGMSTGGNTSGTTGTVSNRMIFAGGNNITLSQSTGAGGNTISIIGGVGGGGGGVAFYDGVNSISSGTARFSASGALTASINGQTLNLSVPATSSLSATGAVSISTNGSTVFIGAPTGGAGVTMTRWEYPNQNINTMNQLVSGGTVSVQRIFLPGQLSAGSFRVGASVNPVTFSSATTQNWSLSLRAGIYTLNASTLSLLTSNSTSYAYTWGSSTAQTSNFIGIREMSMPFPVNIPAGDYWVGLQVSTATGYNTGVGASMNLLGVNSSAMGIFGVMAPFGVNSTSGKDILLGQGFYTSASIPSSIALSAITNNGASQMMRAAFYHAFYNATY